MSIETKLYEPNNALYSNDTGMEDIKKIITNAKKHLNKAGVLIMEFGFNQYKLVENLLELNKFDFEFYKDIQGHYRIVKATYR